MRRIMLFPLSCFTAALLLSLSARASTPPVILCPGGVTAECTGGLTPVTYTATATDSSSSPLPVTCIPASGTGFRRGMSNVVCTATDSLGSSSSCSFTVTVVDTTPPQVTCSTNRVVSTSSASGAVVTYIASASDACGIATFNCSPPSGSTFPSGTATVLCSCLDSAGNSNGCTFTVTVQMPTPPVIACPGGVTAECTGGLTPVTYSVTATNSSGSPVPVICVPPSGTGFRRGMSNVVCTAIDTSGLSSTCTFVVTVVDTTPPRVTCNTNIVVPAASGGGAVVTYIASASDACGIATFDCTPPSGSTFPNGTTTVVCRVTDSAGNPNSCSFTVTVGSANQPPTARIVAAPLADLSPTLPNPVLIAANGSNACLILDGSSSSDPESPNSALSFSWFLQPSPTPFALGPVATNCVDLGTYTYVLVVTDPQGATGTDSLTIDVLTPCEAEGALILIIENSTLPRNVQRSLVSSVKAACASFEKNGVDAGVNQLQAFQNKVRTHVRPLDLALAQQLSDTAQAIIDALTGP